MAHIAAAADDEVLGDHTLAMSTAKEPRPAPNSAARRIPQGRPTLTGLRSRR
jgi:hypothetical protein